jgi:serine/threonine protein kinase
MSSVGRYRIKRVIGRGGMAEVWEAVALGEGGFERRVALKRISPADGGELSFQYGFIDEARIASRLHHANIVGVFDFGVIDGAPFIAMEYVDGLDLARFAALADEYGVEFPAEIALHVATEIGHALAHAHEVRGEDGASLEIVHRDVSPANVLISWAGDVKLADFGIARAADRLALTRVGVARGHLDYMAPEQQARSGVDGRADQFGLACVLHFMFSRRSVVRGGIDPAIPADVAGIIDRATQGAREMRYGHVREMTAELGAALARRLTRDARSTLRAWIERLSVDGRALAEVSRAAGEDRGRRVRPAIAEMFDVELTPTAGEGDRRRSIAALAHSLGHEPTLTPVVGDDDVRRFTAVMARPLGLEEEIVEATEPLTLPPDGLIGRVFDGYRLVERIGEGSIARVYRAVHEVLGREVAVKVLRAEFLDAEEVIERFRAEARLLGSISHPNVVAVLGFGVGERRLPFLVLELVRGPTLADVLAAGELPRARAQAIAWQIFAGLSAVREAGLSSGELRDRDIILVSGTVETVKILDFRVEALERERTAEDFERIACGLVRIVPPRLERVRGSQWSFARAWAAVAMVAVIAGAAASFVLSRLREPVVAAVVESSVPPAVVPRASTAPIVEIRDQEEPKVDEGSPAKKAAREARRPRVARERDEPSQAVVAAASVESSIAAELASEDLIRERLARVSAALTSIAVSRPREEIVALEKRYFELRKRARPPLDRAGIPTLVSELDALEKDLAAR